jgi:hypothetical protein
MKIILGALVAVIAGGSVAFAQPASLPLVELSAGYRLLDPDDDEEEAIERGWHADVAWNVNRFVSLAAQAGGSYESVSTRFANAGITFDGRGSLSIHDLLGGVRLTDRRGDRVHWFGHVLAGLVRPSVDATVTISGEGIPTETERFAESSRNFAFQFGGGIGLPLTRSFGLRLGGELLRVFDDGDSGNLFKLHAGIVIPIGR